MKQNLRVSLGAVVLALATLAALIFAWLNFVQRSEFESPDDGVVWLDTTQGVQAQEVAPSSPAARAGVRAGDHLLAINSSSVTRQVQVTKRLWHAGLWSQVRYRLSRNGEEFETLLVTAPAEKPTSIENYERVVGVIYLFIGLFIFARRWNAPRAVHFYIFCLVSFIFYSFHYSGKLDTFDYEVYWIKIVAQLLMPALLLHFALVFPEHTEGTTRSISRLSLVYLPPLAILFVHISTALGALGFVPWLGSRVLLDKIAYSYLGACLLAAGIVFYRNYRAAAAGVLRQQLKWLTAGTFIGTVPFAVLYIVPYAFDSATKPWMKFTTVSLVFIPLCFGYAIIRYRLMDVDIIFKRGLAYTAATAAVAAIYFFFVALIPQIFHAPANGPVGGIIAIVIAAFLFQPFREWI
ncbi:MAG: histidine kinase N-terminal 7TM domain-containing protein, partial [Candidatus Acidiferrum sp.]